jgi:WD40 repeat protein
MPASLVELQRCVIAIASGKDRFIRLFDISTNSSCTQQADMKEHVSVSPSRCTRVLSGHQGTVLTLTALPQLATAIYKNAANASGKASAKTQQHIYLASGGSDRAIRIWDLGSEVKAGAECVRVLHGHTSRVTSTCVLADGVTLISGGGDGTIRLWDCASGVCLQILRGHEGAVTALTVLKDGVTVASGSSDGTVRMWGF